MGDEVSALQRARAGYRPNLPTALRDGIAKVGEEEEDATTALRDEDEIWRRFPRTFGRSLVRLAARRGGAPAKSLRVGVVLSGGQAPGGHNVISGLFDALRSAHRESRLLGFLGGPRGILRDETVPLGRAAVEPYRNTGGFDMIGSGRDKIETDEQLAACRDTCERQRLDGLVIIGGDDSNTNAAVLAEYLLEQQSATAVVGVPKTIDGDLKGRHVEASFGFDTATKVYAELVGNICRDARSAAKYWHFVKLMGRAASHVTLECALQVQPNLALIGEEVESRGTTLAGLVDEIAELVRTRAEAGRSYGVCLVPEGLIEFVPEFRALIDGINRVLSDREAELADCRSQLDRHALVREALEAPHAAVYDSLPGEIQQQLLLDRDAHGNVQVSRIETERLLAQLVGDRLQGDGVRFRTQTHFFGYEGRCAAPSNFDADYTYTLGFVAAALVARGRTGYIGAVSNLGGPPAEWVARGVPLTSMMQMETRMGKPTPVIGKALVRVDAQPFETFVARRKRWGVEDCYLYPGAIQYFGPPEVRDRPTRTLELERVRS